MGVPALHPGTYWLASGGCPRFGARFVSVGPARCTFVAGIWPAVCTDLGSGVIVHHFSTESVDKSVGILFNRVATAVLAPIVTDWLKIEQMINNHKIQ
jgi:hypothetical protein